MAGTRPIIPVWANQLGGLTFALGDDLHCKWQPIDGPDDPAADLAAEAERIAWLAPHTTVPEVVERGEDADGRWLLTRTIGDCSAVDARWSADPTVVVEALGIGMRDFHDRVPVAECPFDWSIERRIAETDSRSPAADPARPATDRSARRVSRRCLRAELDRLGRQATTWVTSTSPESAWPTVGPTCP